MSLIKISNWAAEEGANPLIPHTAELVVGFIAFSLLFLVLRSKVVPMFEKAFAERTQAIQGGMEKAERAQIEAVEKRVIPRQDGYDPYGSTQR